MSQEILSVTQLNFYVKSTLDSDKNLNDLYVNGEISNFKVHYASGCAYFSIKDSNSSIHCMMFRDFLQKLDFTPKDGMFVLIRGRVTLYTVSGLYQIIAKDITPVSQGDIDLSFKITKEKLLKEGLFDSKYKQPLPQFPQKIGIITSANAAVLQDVKNILNRRYPLANLILGKASVQGREAVADIIKNLEIFNKYKAAEVIIIARGGGSAEDLSAFNEESLARAIFASKIPVVSAVGHETDFSICDFVADVRAATPSEAAEIVSPNLSNVLEDINYASRRLDKFIFEKFFDFKLKLKEISSDMFKNLEDKLEILKKEILFLESKLNILNPKNILQRGYTIVKDKNGKLVTGIEDIKINSHIFITFSDGVVETNILSKKEKS